MNKSWLLYGASGYTGALIAKEALARGHRPILAGRRREAVEPMAGEMGLEFRVFDLGAGLAAGLEGVRAVLHSAGPFVHTSAPMVGACLAAGAHYLDITGEISVFESVLARRQEAREKGCVLLPGVGFDVVPSDSLAARLHAALPAAVALDLAFHVQGGTWSGGTLKTMIEALPHAGAIRREGRIVPVPLAWDARDIPFSCGTRHAMTIAWGDVSTAFHTTGIRNIRVYSGAAPAKVRRLRRLRPLLPLLGWGPVKRSLSRWAGRRVHGPDAAMRERARIYLWGEARDADNRAASATMEVGEGYSFTALSAVRAVERVLSGEIAPGAYTPTLALGMDFVAGIPGVDVHPVRTAAAG